MTLYSQVWPNFRAGPRLIVMRLPAILQGAATPSVVDLLKNLRNTYRPRSEGTDKKREPNRAETVFSKRVFAALLGAQDAPEALLIGGWRKIRPQLKERTNENNTDVDRWTDARRLRINGKRCSKPRRSPNLRGTPCRSR
jgi:hypothetical protein